MIFVFSLNHETLSTMTKQIRVIGGSDFWVIVWPGFLRLSAAMGSGWLVRISHDALMGLWLKP